MAEYSLRIDETTGVTIVEIVGAISIAQQLQFFNSSTYEKRTLKLVTDLRRATYADLSLGELAKLMRAVKPISREGLRGAWVLEKGSDFSKLKAVRAQVEALEFPGTHKIFSDIEQAISWVQE